MSVKVRTSQIRLPIIRGLTLLAAGVAGAGLLILPCTQAAAAPWTRAHNPQPLPPGVYSPYHPGPISSRAKVSPNAYRARHVCVAWGRVCVKAGQGTRTHPAPCGQYIYVCRKYG